MKEYNRNIVLELEKKYREQLLPCPLCGTDSPWLDMIVREDDIHYEEQFIIECRHCNIEFKHTENDYGKNLEPKFQRVVGKWNTRAPYERLFVV